MAVILPASKYLNKIGMVGLIKPSLRWDNYYGLTHFIVPPIAKEIEEPKKM